MKTKYIFNYVFVIGLLVLMLNDHVLKGMFGNWFTGKLSDFAGILILPMLIAFLFRWGSNKSIVVSVLFFVFWKSGLSQGFIDSFNALDVLPIGRVIDYSDFLSFLILPFSKYVIDHVERFEIRMEYFLIKRMALGTLFFVVLVTFIATTVPETSNILVRDIRTCCEMEPINEEIGNGKIFIPTAFTPDGDGENDFFQPSIDSNIMRIDTFLVFASQSRDTLVQIYNATEVLPGFGFNGVEDFRFISGQFEYLVHVTSKDEISQSFRGTVCSLPCDAVLGSLQTQPDSILNCAFGNQFDKEVGYDESIESGEELECYR